VLFAHRGVEIIAVEPSPQMVAFARHACADYPNVSFVVATFEELPMEHDSFDLIFSAQAWHWVSRDLRYANSRAALHPNGTLALFWTHPLWDQSLMTSALTTVYEEWAPELCTRGPWFPGFRGPVGAERPKDDELAGYFGPITERCFDGCQGAIAGCCGQAREGPLRCGGQAFIRSRAS